MKKIEREVIFSKYGGKCAYCGTDLEKGWHADHIKPIIRKSKYNRKKGKYVQTGECERPENEIAENYNPSCPSCNIQKNSYTVEEFRRNIKKFVKSLNLYSTQYKFAKKYGLIKENEIKVTFYYETLKKK